jgi:hypothetical protein
MFGYTVYSQPFHKQRWKERQFHSGDAVSLVYNVHSLRVQWFIEELRSNNPKEVISRYLKQKP